MSHSIAPAQLLTQNLSTLTNLTVTTGILDLACGTGRNGLYLAALGLPVIFADKNPERLAGIKQQLQNENLPSICWQVDLEQNSATVLQDTCVDALLVFNYLHRPLMSGLKAAVRPGGLIFYETFTVDNRQFGRPSNPDFLLQPGELAEYFNDWQVLHNHEGTLHNPQRAIAQIIARRPEQIVSESQCGS